jgi:hypothetical protein
VIPAGVAPSPYPGGMDQPSERDDEAGDLLSTLEVIEAQPLATRADAYEALHDTLARRLEATPGASS